MPLIPLIHDLGATGTVESPVVRLPAKARTVWMEAILAAPPDGRHIFDLLLVIERKEQYGRWIAADRTELPRSVAKVYEPLYWTVKTRIADAAGTEVRAFFSCGQAPVAVSVALRY